MSYTFPIFTTSFWDLLPAESQMFHLPRISTDFSLGSGDSITSELADPRWRGTVNLAPDPWVDHERIAALVRVLMRPGATFNATPYQARAQTGGTFALASSSAPNLAAFSGVGASVTLPVGYFFSMNYGGPHRLHQIAEAAVANGSGLTPEVEIVPPLEPGWVVGQVVTRTKPLVRAKIIPSSVQQGTMSAGITSGLSFDWVQTFR